MVENPNLFKYKNILQTLGTYRTRIRRSSYGNSNWDDVRNI